MAVIVQGEAANNPAVWAWPESPAPHQEPLPDAEVQALSIACAAVYRYKRRTDAAARADGVQPEQYVLLLAVAAVGEREWRSSRELAAELCHSHRELTQLAQRCEAAGLVQTTRDPEYRRGARVRLTPHGSRLATRLARPERAALATLAEQLASAV